MLSFNQPQKDERLSQFWSPPVVLNPGSLLCSKILTTRISVVFFEGQLFILSDTLFLTSELSFRSGKFHLCSIFPF